MEIPATIRLLVLDVDGVLTDGRVRLSADGTEQKVFHARDGLAIRLWMQSGRELALVTGRAGPAVEARAAELGIRHLFTGVHDKAAALRTIQKTIGTQPEATAVMGDDLPDLPMLRAAAWPAAPADAAPEIRAAARQVTTAPGGAGAVREVIESLLRAAGEWHRVIAPYTGEDPDRPMSISG